MTEKPYPTRRQLREAERARQVAQQEEERASEHTDEATVPGGHAHKHSAPNANPEAPVENVASAAAEPEEVSTSNAPADTGSNSADSARQPEFSTRRAHRHARAAVEQSVPEEKKLASKQQPEPETLPEPESEPEPKTALLATPIEAIEPEQVIPASDSAVGNEHEDDKSVDERAAATESAPKHKGFWSRFRKHSDAEPDAADDASGDDHLQGDSPEKASTPGVANDLPLLDDDKPLIGGSLLGNDSILSDTDVKANYDSAGAPESDDTVSKVNQFDESPTRSTEQAQAGTPTTEAATPTEASTYGEHQSVIPPTVVAPVITDAEPTPSNLTLPPRSKGHTLAAPINQTGEVILSTGTVTLPSSMSQTGRIDLHLDSTVPTAGHDLGDVASTEHRPVSAKDAIAGFDSKTVLPKATGTSNGLTIALAIAAGVLLITAAALLTAYLIIRNG